ncbi:DEKNAAE104192 [Brettanomyces naardenensis]|uniref:DEKNAAE104192 n=1 Tax=Brettanomyces naardenensis TaxID=13370 RepID=A0A448YQD2_BRENA|nr:DEKNAAE104192 [Brettanomyces naardenensis]
MGIKIALDRGGTFTDCIGNPGSNDPADDVIIKLLSVDPQNYPDANLEAIRRLLQIFQNKKIPRGQPLDTSGIESLRMGTTVATNALLERKGERCALVTTKGFKDILVIGTQARPNIFDLSVSKPALLYDTVVEVDERVTLEDFVEDPDHKITQLGENKDLVQGLSKETVRILKRPNLDEVRSVLQLVYDSGIRSIAICLMHSYTFPDHELLVGKIAQSIGFEHISLSSQLTPMIKYVARANSSVADAYLTPEIKKYLRGFESGLKQGFQHIASGKTTGVRCQFMQSDGGLVDASSFSGLRAILSGPAGGVVGYARTCYDSSNKIPLIGFDMGGTSTDVSRFGDGKFDHVFETTTAGVTIQSPQLDINTVAAGGGSILTYKNGLFQVGPESASSHPGPACYRKGGPLTVTDANLFLGRLVPEFFPKIFGPNEDQGLDYAITEKKFKEVTDEINSANPDIPPMTPQQVAHGFLSVACENMARPVRQLTEAKGHVLSSHRLVSFGGAGGQCAYFVAELLGIETILIHRYSSVLSAYGMALADVVEEVQEPAACILDDESKDLLERSLDELKDRAHQPLQLEGFADENIVYEEYLNLRYQGTESAIMVPKGEGWNFKETFCTMHQREFGFLFDKPIIVDDIRVRGIGKAVQRNDNSVDDQIKELGDRRKSVDKRYVSMKKSVWWDSNEEETAIYRLEDLPIGSEVHGPAIIADGTQTNVIPPGGVALVLKTHLVVEVHKEAKEKTTLQPSTEASSAPITIHPVLLSIFSHRFMDIAVQMGNSLQKTSVSVNVKERLDFSCALFDSEGNLVANAPHVPVHLGSMSTCIAEQAKIWEGKLQPGDVLITNHPSAGGTHLPDITLITPAFDNGKIIFYVAARAHHADIGGMSPGSMPPNSTELWQEGATFYSELLVKQGVFQEEMVIDKLSKEPAKYAGCSGSRRLSDNLSDLKAQLAANQKGISLIGQLVKEFDLPTIMAYMHAIQDNAADTVSKMLDRVIAKHGIETLHCIDYMDDGSVIKLKVRRNEDTGKIVFDFTGSAPQAYNNLNAPHAITYSAIIYCLRCLVDEDIPLNQGCIRPIEVIIPKSSLLDPDSGCAVVGGNVCTSQRVTDTILKAFHVMADSQGCCNNFTFGSEGFGYYETIAGGHGASATWNGVSGVHTNMTNTRITDAEVFEKRYPIILRDFSIRKNSGGSGLFKGGDGVRREIEFRMSVNASVLSERRVIAPHGMEGGEDGERGLNLWIRKSHGKEQVISIGGKASVDVGEGDRIVILTPGGGGWGKVTQ